MSPRIAKCIVFDDDEHQLHFRVSQVDRMLGALVRGDQIDLLDAELSERTKRADVLDDVLDHQTPGAPVLVLADMAAERNRHRGNIGARLIRAIAQHPVTGPGTRRVVWSRQTVSSVTDDLARWVHATATYSAASTDDLADAVRHTISTHPPWTEPRQFPAARTIAQWEDDVRNAVEDLVGDEGALIGDDVIALRMFEGIPDVATNELLRTIQGPHRPNAMAFVNAVRAHGGLGSTDEARRYIEDVIGPVAEDRVADAIYPSVCDTAWECMRNLQARGIEADAYRAVTWLTAPEQELMSTFLKLYVAATSGLHGNNANDRTAAINRILGSSPDGDAHQTWTATAHRLGLAIPDLAYALWTMNDIQSGR